MNMKQALVIIDVQNFYFYDGPMKLWKPEEAEQEMKKVIDYFRDTQQPVIYIQHLYDGGGYAESQEEIIQIHKNIQPMDGEIVVRKSYPSSFRETTLQDILKPLGITKLVIAGMMSHMCVDTTVRAAYDLGYQIDVIADGCTTMDLEYKGTVIPAEIVTKTYMASLNGMFARVLNADEFLSGEAE